MPDHTRITRLVRILEKPGLQARAALESTHTSQHSQPGALDAKIKELMHLAPVLAMLIIDRRDSLTTTEERVVGRFEQSECSAMPCDWTCCDRGF